MRSRGFKCYNIKCNSCLGKSVCAETADIALRCKDRLVCMQTHADRIRAMSDEELAEWLADIFDCHDCSEHERLGDNPLLLDEQCDQECEKHCLDWLKQPYEDGDTNG